MLFMSNCQQHKSATSSYSYIRFLKRVCLSVVVYQILPVLCMFMRVRLRSEFWWHIWTTPVLRSTWYCIHTSSLQHWQNKISSRSFYKQFIPSRGGRPDLHWRHNCIVSSRSFTSDRSRTAPSATQKRENHTPSACYVVLPGVQVQWTHKVLVHYLYSVLRILLSVGTAVFFWTQTK